jgi:type IV pilus assembly protein PilV
MTARTSRRAPGFTLLEVLVSILILALGVIGLVGLVAVSTKNSTEAMYRSEAALLVNQLLGTMWVSDRTIATLQKDFNTGGDRYNTWRDQVKATLPGVVENTPTAPTVDVDATGLVTVAVFWIAPGDPAMHNLTVVAQIRNELE